MPGAKVTPLEDGRLEFEFSQSWLNDYAICPERARRGLLKPEFSPPTDATAIGQAMHSYIEHVLCGEAGDPFDTAAEVFRSEMNQPGARWVKVKTEGTALRYVTNACDAWREYVYPQLCEPVGIESKFNILAHEDDRFVIRLAGTADFTDGELWDWKGLWVGTPLMTPTGWTTMGEVAVGDYIYGRSGKPVQVIAKSDISFRTCYQIGFDDGSTLVADNVHLWETSSHGVISTDEIVAAKARGEVVRIANAEPIEGLPNLRLDLDPYLLGLWLGDGSTNAGAITTIDPEVIQAFIDGGFPLRRQDEITYHFDGLRLALAELGVLGGKFIPDYYLNSTVEQRLALLQGLMDSDGNWNVCRSQACFDSTNSSLANAVYQLVCSLGWKASVYDGTTNFEDAKPYRRISFTPHTFNPFRLRRKAELVSPDGTTRCRRRTVASITKCLTVPTQCISVGGEDKVYLAGDQMVPTHNTAGSRKPYDPQEKQRWAIQPTVYTFAAHMGQLDADPSKFTYAVMFKDKFMAPQFVPVTRGPEDWAWLVGRVYNIAAFIAENGYGKPWPLLDQHWLCSEKWCDHFRECRGSTTEVFLRGIKPN